MRAHIVDELSGGDGHGFPAAPCRHHVARWRRRNRKHLDVDAAALGGITLPSTPTELTVIIALALICSAYGFITQAYVQPHVPAETTGFALSLEPVCSAVFSFFLVGEVLTPIAFLGAALIMAGVFVATIEPPRLHAPAYPQEAMTVEPEQVS